MSRFLCRAGFFRTAIIVTLMLVAALVAAGPRSMKASGLNSVPYAVGLDGNGINNSCSPSSCASYSEQLSTTINNDVVIVIAHCSSCGITDGAGLQFALRATHHNSYGDLSEYYAIANAQLTSDLITISGLENPFMHVFAVHGYLSGIFDTTTPLFVDCPNAPCAGSIAPSGSAFVYTGVANLPADRCGAVSGWSRLFVNGMGASDYQIKSKPDKSDVSYLCLHYYDTGGTSYGATTLLMDAIALPRQAYQLDWQGYDWDGASEETISLNGHSIGSLPAADSPQNSGVYTFFSLNITSAIAYGTNTLTFTHANWDCAISDNVEYLHVFNGQIPAYANSTSRPLTCTQSLTYTFDIGIASGYPQTPPITATFDRSPTYGNVGQSFRFNASATGGAPPYTFTWDFGDGSHGTGSSITHSYSTAGDYWVGLTVTDSASPPDTGGMAERVFVTAPSGSYIMYWQGYDWDGGGEETLMLNGHLMVSLPTTDTPANGGSWTSFSLNITSYIVKGTNTITFTHAKWDCSTSDNVRNLQVTSGSIAVYNSSASQPLSCTQSLTYTFTV